MRLFFGKRIKFLIFFLLTLNVIVVNKLFCPGIPSYVFLGNISENVFLLQEQRIRNFYRQGLVESGRDPSFVDSIVLHGTGGGSTRTIIHWLNNSYYPRRCEGIGLFHYLVSRNDPVIVEIVSPFYFTHHANASDEHAYKQIGIELVNHHPKNKEGYTNLQYNMLFILMFDYIFKDFKNIKYIYGHRHSIWKHNKRWKARRVDKRCPGPFNWGLLEKELTKRGYGFKKIGKKGKEGYKIWIKN